MPEAHAKLSPSAAERWAVCPGSIDLSKGMPERTSAFAEEGTRAHSVAEAMLNGGPFEATDEMISQVKVYVDHVDELADHPDAILHTELQVKISDDLWGTVDAVVWRPDQKTLYIQDLKYGAGVGVEVSDNLQLKIYGLATLLTLKYPAQIINVGIVQPRFPHPDGPVRSKDYDDMDMVAFHADIVDAIKRVKAAHQWGDLIPKWLKSDKQVDKDAVADWCDKFLKPTEKACRWCLAAPKCPKLASKSQELAKVAFEVPYDKDQLARTLDFLPILEGYVKNVREFAYTEAEKGNVIPGYKLVPKVATRKLKDGVELPLAHALGVPVVDLYAAPKMLGVSDLQKLAPGKNDGERANVLEPFVTKESSGHTLVHDSDKRGAIRVDAQSAFAGFVQ